MNQSLDYKTDKRRSHLVIAEAYQTMSFILRHYVLNSKGATAAYILSWLWALGLGSLSRPLSSFTLDRWVSHDEWLLVKHYSEKHRII